MAHLELLCYTEELCVKSHPHAFETTEHVSGFCSFGLLLGWVSDWEIIVYVHSTPCSSIMATVYRHHGMYWFLMMYEYMYPGPSCLLCFNFGTCSCFALICILLHSSMFFCIKYGLLSSPLHSTTMQSQQRSEQKIEQLDLWNTLSPILEFGCFWVAQKCNWHVSPSQHSTSILCITCCGVGGSRLCIQPPNT